MGNCMESEGVVPLNNSTFDPNMVNHSIDLYFFSASAPSRATLMLIKALGIKCNVKVTNLMAGEHMTPEFLKINPMHTLPTINDQGFILWDSHVIMKYLTDRYAKDDSLYPKDPRKGALVNQRLYFEATNLFPRFNDYMIPVVFRGESPSESATEKLKESLSFLDNFLRDQKWVAGGENLSIADFSIVATVSTIEALGFDISQYENVMQWYRNTKNALGGFGYDEVNQKGADLLGEMFKSKLN